jgi:hypothetical protein
MHSFGGSTSALASTGALPSDPGVREGRLARLAISAESPTDVRFFLVRPSQGR